MNTSPERLEPRAVRWLGLALALTLLVSALGATALRASGASWGEALDGVGATHGVWLTQPPRHCDSWFPMTAAYGYKDWAQSADLYGLFFDEHIKFQYPPSSLLILDLLPRDVVIFESDDDVPIGSRVVAWLTWPARLACLIAVACTVTLFEISLATRLGRRARERGGRRWLRVLLATAITLTFYPLVRGYELGQVQIFLNASVTLALLLQLLGMPVASGVLFGLCCLVKPQYGVLVLLALIWRDWRFGAGLLGTFFAGLGISIARFGLHDHVRYLDVLQWISRRGETYWPNQSVNGLLNRFLENGDAATFMSDQFAPYLRSVHVASLASTVVFVGLALWPERRRRLAAQVDHETKTLATALVLAAATMGSPVAWEHHYGSFIAIFALVMPRVLVTEPWGRWTAPLLALSYVVMANAILQPEWLFQNRWLGLLGSHLFLGSVILFGLLWSLQSSHLSRQQRARPAMSSSSGEGLAAGS